MEAILYGNDHDGKQCNKLVKIESIYIIINIITLSLKWYIQDWAGSGYGTVLLTYVFTQCVF